VVGAQLHDLPPVEQVDQAVEQRGIGTVPAVDGLVGVTHRAEVAVGPEPRLEQFELQRVDVLELVDEQVAEPPALGLGEARVGPERLGAALEQIVEVDQPAGALGRFVTGEDLFHQTGVDRRPPAPALERGAVAVGADGTGSGPIDLHLDPGQGRAIEAGPTDPAQHAAPVGQQRRLPLALIVPAGPQHRQRHGVERAGGRQVAQAERPQSAAQLSGRLPGERDAQRPPAVEIALAGPVGDPPGEHAGLARPGAGPDDQRT
jgi:hypothetical protein